jgi:hypothetical protein
MSVFCKGCRKTKVNEDFGYKDNGEQYKTCKKCRSKKIKKIEEEEEIPDCCDAEAIRDTFKQLNCDIVYVKDLKYMFDLDSGIARAIFSGMIKTSNFVIVETITWPNYCFIMNLLTHLGFDVDDIKSYNINIVIYKNSHDAMMRVKSCSANNIFAGFMKCLKLPNKRMCDICNNKKKCFRTCFKCKNKMCYECFKNHNKDYVNSCPYCRYDIIEHSKMNMFINDTFPNGIEM